MSKRITPVERFEKREKKFKGHYENFQTWFPKVLRIDPEWARQIYAGEKTWEFRKKALPLHKPVYLFEKAPVNAITGVIGFDAMVATCADEILSSVKRHSDRHFDSPGKRAAAFLKSYAKDFETVFAMHVRERKMFERPVVAGVEDDRGVYLDVPANPIEPATFSFRDMDDFIRLLDEFNGATIHYFWSDPAEAVERYDRIRNAKEAGNA